MVRLDRVTENYRIDLARRFASILAVPLRLPPDGRVRSAHPNESGAEFRYERRRLRALQCPAPEPTRDLPDVAAESFGFGAFGAMPGGGARGTWARLW